MTGKLRIDRFLMLALILGLAGFLLPLLDRSPYFNVGFYLLATTLLSFDLLDLAFRIWLSRMTPKRQAAEARRPSAINRSPLQPYALVMSVHNLKIDARASLNALLPYKSRTWIIDDCSTDDTALYLRSMGWRCLSSDTNLKKPAAIRKLLEHLPKEIKTVVVLDPDSAPVDSGTPDSSDLEQAVQTFQYEGAAASCPRIRIRDDGPLTSFQSLECEMAFTLGRKGLSPHCITSGVSIYDRSALRDALSEHSLSVYAEDLENSVILLNRGLSIHFAERLVIETDGKTSLSDWFSQRVGWSFGLIRVCVERRREIRHAAHRSPWSFYNFAIYMGIMTVVLFPVKAVGIVVLAASFLNAVDSLFSLELIPDTELTDPTYFSTMYTAYSVLAACMVAYLKPPARPAAMIMAVSFYLFYAVANAAAMFVGYLNWISLRLFGRRVYRDHYIGGRRDAGIRPA